MVQTLTPVNVGLHTLEARVVPELSYAAPFIVIGPSNLVVSLKNFVQDHAGPYRVVSDP